MSNILKTISLILVLISTLSCSTKQIMFRTHINYKSKDGSYWKQKKKVYSISVPRGFEKNKILGDHEHEIQLVYSDSSILYISDDITSGSYSNWKNLDKIESKTLDYLYKDTVINQGLTDTGYWKELKLKSIVVGYLNVPTNKKEIFDKSLVSIH